MTAEQGERRRSLPTDATPRLVRGAHRVAGLPTRQKCVLIAAMLVAWLAWPAATVAAPELTRSSSELVQGRDPASGVEFSARARGGEVRVELGLPGGKRVVALIDDAAGSVSLRSLAADGSPAPVEQADVRTLDALRRDLGPVRRRVGDALSSTLALLSEAPPGIVLDVATRAAATNEATPAIRPLCSTARAVGSYTLGAQRVSTTVTVGPCYAVANECLGRCGRDCRSTTVAGFSNPETVQRFTQDCLNHDLCADRTSDNLGQCADEFVAAVDDFLAAPDCGSLTGAWIDSLGAAWLLQQRADLSVRGTVALPRCGRLAVTGRHQGAGVALTATSASPPAGCPARVAYAGRLGSCAVASGTATAAGDAPDPWRLARAGAR